MVMGRKKKNGKVKQIVGSTLSDSKESGSALVDLSRAAAIEALHAYPSGSKEGKYAIVTDGWQKFNDVYLEEILDFLANYVHKFLVYGVDVEGKSTSL
ncbi:hypothetical protein ACE6H2_002070 [Prunus campanulata]